MADVNGDGLDDIIAAFVMGIPEHKLRVISPDVGGGFGSKIFQYPEEIIVLYAAKKLGKPVKWTAKRSESFMTDSHGRDHVSTAEMCADADGNITGLRVNLPDRAPAWAPTSTPSIQMRPPVAPVSPLSV